jgi:hypothetical protein
MSKQFSYDQGVSGFDQTFGLPMRQFVPTLLRLARLAPGQRVLDIAIRLSTRISTPLSKAADHGGLDMFPCRLMHVNGSKKTFGVSWRAVGLPVARSRWT